jgi:hypothetical protein
MPSNSYSSVHEKVTARTRLCVLIYSNCGKLNVTLQNDSVTLSFEEKTYFLGATRRPNVVDIYALKFLNHSLHDKVTVRTHECVYLFTLLAHYEKLQNENFTLTFEVGSWSLDAKYRFELQSGHE